MRGCFVWKKLVLVLCVELLCEIIVVNEIKLGVFPGLIPISALDIDSPPSSCPLLALNDEPQPRVVSMSLELGSESPGDRRPAGRPPCLHCGKLQKRMMVLGALHRSHE